MATNKVRAIKAIESLIERYRHKLLKGVEVDNENGGSSPRNTNCNKGGMKMKFDIVYADPPWWEAGGGKIKRGADKHYPLMKTEEIMALNVSKICKPNAHLYLWATNNHLMDAFKVMEAWGFRYITTITWVKDRFGLGQYFRGQTEHCLFGVKGRIPYKVVNGKRQQGTTVIFAPRKAHSEKPEEMRQLIEKVSDRPGFNKIELFARERVEGWYVWGNEINADIQL